MAFLYLHANQSRKVAQNPGKVGAGPWPLEHWGHQVGEEVASRDLRSLVGESHLPTDGPMDLRSLRDRTEKYIRAAIVSGALEPGRLYSVAYFARTLGVSATPVREALFKILDDGLLELARNQGFRVPVLSRQYLDEVYVVRRMLEVPAMEELAAHAESIDFARFASMADSMVDQAARGDVGSFLWLDRSFHVGLIEAIGNSVLADMVLRLRDRSRLPGLAGLARQGKLAESAREHGVLLRLLEARDVQATRALMEAHLRHTRGMWATGVADSEGSSAPEAGDRILG